MYKNSLFIVACLIFFSCNKPIVSENQKANVLMIAVDDLNIFGSVYSDLPNNFLQMVYPDTIVRQKVMNNLTPNIQRLSNMGLTFNNAYCASPLCGPSRTALLTGVPPHVSGYYHHDQHFRGYKSLTNTVTLPQYLTDNGYFTLGLGKVFHKGEAYLDRGVFSDWPDRLFSWSEYIEVPIGTGKARGVSDPVNENISKYWDGKNKPGYTRFGTTNLPKEKSADYNNALFSYNLVVKGKAEIIDRNNKLRVVELPEDKPWFVACGIFAPHLPFVAPQKYFELFPMEEMNINRELYNWVKDGLKDLSPTGKRITSNNRFTEMLDYGIKLDGKDGDINAWRELFQSYLAIIAYADACVGVLVDAVIENPAKNNTIVILWSDHGFHLGDKMREAKTTLWEASNHSNFIIYDPAYPESHGKQTNAMVSLQDIYPTLVCMLGLNKPEHVHGYKLTALLENPGKAWPHPVLSTYEEGNHTIRTSNYRYIRFKNGDRELYNFINDPFELVNLVNYPDYEEKLNELNDLLDMVLTKTANDY